MTGEAGKTVRGNARKAVPRKKAAPGARSKTTAPAATRTHKKKSGNIKYVLTAIFLIILILSAVIVILDQRAMKKGHVGLWESVTGIRPAVTLQDVEKSCSETLDEFGIPRNRMVREGWTTIKNRDNERLRHLIYTVPDNDTFQRLTARFEDRAGQNGVTVHNRHVMRQPREWILSYYVGTHGERTHKYDFHYYLEGTPTPAPLPPRLQTPAPGDGTADETGTPPVPAVANPKIAMIFDDFGSDLGIAERFLTEMQVPFTIAVLPYQEHSAEIIAMTGKAGQTSFLHMPMEPLDADAMGNLAEYYLLTSMDDETLRSKTRAMLQDFNGVSGVNNHTGSRMSADRRAMDIVLSEIKKRNLIFVDSRTTVDTVAESIAREMGIPAGARQVFLDQGYNGGDVTANMLKLAGIAREKGFAIGIGHAIDATLNDVKNVLPQIQESGVSIVPVRSLVN